MDPYKILNIDNDATLDDIKKAYRKLVLTYHPDKCKDPDASDKFIALQSAYEILSNSDKKKEYDLLNSVEKLEYYKAFTKLISNKYPKFTDYFNKMINMFYDNKSDFENDFNKFVAGDYQNVYDNIITKIPSVISSMDLPYKNQDNKILNIIGKVKTSLKDRYLNKYMKINVARTTRPDTQLYVKLRDDSSVFKMEGETHNGYTGDVILAVVISDTHKFSYENHDIYYSCEIPLFIYLYGGNIDIQHIDGEQIKLDVVSMVSNYRIPNKGLPYGPDDNLQRGDLIISLKIQKLDSIKDKIYNIYD